MELVARVKSALRRYTLYNTNNKENNNIEINGLVIDKEKHKCMLYEKEIDLTPMEFDILLYLATNRGKVISSEELFENDVFSYCQKLTTLIIPDGVKSIGNYAFSGCTSLTSITIPDGVTSIGEAAFDSCTSLTSIVVSDSVTTIDKRAFNNCYNLTTVYYGGTSIDWNDISIDDGDGYLIRATRYYYSESEPSSSGNYWHYVDGIPTPW